MEPSAGLRGLSFVRAPFLPRLLRRLCATVVLVMITVCLAETRLEAASARHAREQVLDAFRNLPSSGDPTEALEAVLIKMNEHFLRFGAEPRARVDWSPVRDAAFSLASVPLDEIDQAVVLDIVGDHAAAARVDTAPVVFREEWASPHCVVMPDEIENDRRAELRNYRATVTNDSAAVATFDLSADVFRTYCGRMGLFTANAHLGHARALASAGRDLDAIERVGCAHLAVEREAEFRREYGEPIPRAVVARYRAATSATLVHVALTRAEALVRTLRSTIERR